MSVSKKELRKSITEKRRLMDYSKNDALIFENLLTLGEFVNADTVLCYASLESEINSDCIIDYALQNGKTVGVPYCTDTFGKMRFYRINSLSDLSVGKFGIREPKPDRDNELTKFKNCVIIVPALCYNRSGFRLGYGGGYYDRFLKDFKGVSIGLCYGERVFENIPVNDYDIPVNIIVCENEIIYCNNGGKNG